MATVKAKAEITISRIVDIEKVTRYYLVQSSTASAPSKPTTNPPGGSWVTTEPSYTSGSTTSLYFVDQTLMTNGTFSYSEVSKSSSYEAAKEAWNKANNAQSSIDDLTIGGRNLFLNTGVEYSNAAYQVSNYKPANDTLTAGEVYTISICVTPAENVAKISTYFSSGYKNVADLVVTGTEKQIVSKTFTMSYYDGKTPEDDLRYSYMQLYRFPNDGTVTGSTTIHWVKVEKGNKATDWTPAPEDVDNNIKDATDAIAVGGRNYVKKLDDSVTTLNGITVDVTGNEYRIYGTNTNTSANYSIGEYWLSATDIFEPGETYTVSTTAPLPTGLYLGINTSNSSGTTIAAGDGSYHYGDGSKTSTTFVCSEASSGSAICFFGVMKTCGTVDITFKIKLEKGNKATDWTPTPEDVEEGIGSAEANASEAIERITAAEQTIDSIKGYISNLIVDENGESLVIETSTGYSFNFGEYSSGLSKVSEDLEGLIDEYGSTEAVVEALQKGLTDLTTKTQYVNIGTYDYKDSSGNVTKTEPSIILGDTENEKFQVLITNTQIVFQQGSLEPTRITTTGMETENITVEQDLVQTHPNVTGKYAWAVRASGNYGLQWKEDE